MYVGIGIINNQFKSLFAIMFSHNNIEYKTNDINLTHIVVDVSLKIVYGQRFPHRHQIEGPPATIFYTRVRFSSPPSLFAI